MKVTTEQVLAFRTHRGGLAYEQPATTVETARRILGAQAQIETHAYNAVSLRTSGRPQDQDIKAQICETRELIRTWGQRDTLHLYAKEDWPLFQIASTQWVRSGRRGGMPPEGLVAEVDDHFAREGRALTRSDLFPLIPPSYVESLVDHPGAGGSKEGAERFAATRLIWVLANQGKIVFDDKIGREVSYLHRSVLWSGDWPELDPEVACQEVVRRYLAAFGPATVQDAAHYLGARVSDVRPWFEAITDELITCHHAERGQFQLLKADESSIKNTPDRWPLRLVPAYDTSLMSHKDKRWILPQADLEPRIWKRAAVVSAPVMMRGQIVGTWTYKKTKTRVDLQIEDFGMVKIPAQELKSEHESLAFHLGVETGKVSWDR